MKAILTAALLICLTRNAAHCGEAANAQQSESPDLMAIRAELKASGFEPVRPLGNPSAEAGYWLQWRGWARRVLFVPMKATTASTPWGAGAVAFAEKALEARYTPRWIEDAGISLAPEAQRLMAAGADDAVFLWLAAETIALADGSWLNARDVAAKARESFRKSKYPRVLGALLYAQKSSHIIPAWKHADMDEAILKARDFFLESLTEADVWQPGDAAIYIAEIEGEFTRSFCREYPEKLRPVYFSGTFPEWARETLAGIWEAHMGWQDRGAGWAAGTLTADTEPYARHLQTAARHLQKAWELDPRQPFAPGHMIAVAVATGEKPRDWFDRSISARIDYRPAWTALNRALRPDRGGSIRAMLAQALAAVETGRFDTEAPFYFIHALDDIQDVMPTYDACRDVYKQPAIRSAMTLMCEGYSRHSHSRGEREHFAWWRALGAWLSGRFEAGEAALADTGKRPEPDFVRYRLSRFFADQIKMRGEFALAGGGGLADWNRLGAAYDRMEIADAARILTQLPQSPNAKPLLRRTGVLLDMEQRLASGEWVKLTADPELSCWQWYTGSWSADNHGNLVATGDDERALITHRVKIGPAFDARGSFLCPVKNLTDFEAGLAVTHLTTARGFGGFTAPSLWWNGSNFQASVDERWNQSGVPFKTVPGFDQTKPVRWAARMEGGKFTWLINGAVVYQDESLMDGRIGSSFNGKAPNSRFGFSLRRSPGHSSVTFSPVEIRRIK